MGEAICVSGDAHNLPTPSLGDKVEPLQKPTKGNHLSFFVVSGFWAQVLGFSMQLSFNFQTVWLGVLYFHGICFSEYLIKYLKCFFFPFPGIYSNKTFKIVPSCSNSSRTRFYRVIDIYTDSQVAADSRIRRRIFVC